MAWYSVPPLIILDVFSYSMGKRASIFIDMDKDEFINPDDLLHGHFISNYAPDGDRSGAILNHLEPDLHNVTILGGVDEVDL